MLSFGGGKKAVELGKALNFLDQGVLSGTASASCWSEPVPDKTPSAASVLFGIFSMCGLRNLFSYQKIWSKKRQSNFKAFSLIHLVSQLFSLHLYNLIRLYKLLVSSHEIKSIKSRNFSYCYLFIFFFFAVYINPAELGDYDSTKHTYGYVSEFRLAQNQTKELEYRISELHKQLKGVSPAQAEFNYLDKVKWLDMYGVDLHPVLVSTIMCQ